MNFFVIGLPRSRTAWLSNFLTYDGHFCHHEGLNNCLSMKEYKEKLGDDGDSCTGLMFVDLEKEFPKAKKLIIESDVNKSIDFMYKTYGVYNPEYCHFMKERLDEMTGKRIAAEEINTHLSEIWDYLIGTPYNERRGDMLSSMNIQVQDPFNYDMNAAAAFLNEQPLFHQS